MSLSLKEKKDAIE